MDKKQRREKRKAKEQQRKTHHEVVRNRQPFDEIKDEVRPFLLRAYKDARREYPQLLNVVEFPHDPERPTDSDAELIGRYVGKRYEQIMFNLMDGGHSSGGKDFGGMTIFFRDPGKKDKAVIFLRTQAALSAEHMAAMNIAVFYHELGHVDDFTKGLYLIPDNQNIDIAAAEYHAHQFACRRLYEAKMRIPLSIWLAAIERQMVDCGVPNVEKAAQMLIDSPDYKKFRAMAEPFMHCWNETFKKERLETSSPEQTTAA